MELLEVPIVTQLPELSGQGDSPGGFADMVLTTLLAYPSACLVAEYSPETSSVSWMIDPHSEDFCMESIEFACSPTLSSFRAVLARMANAYMGGQLENGYALKWLRQGSILRECRFYLSNTQISGFWIRIYTNPVGKNKALKTTPDLLDIGNLS